MVNPGNALPPLLVERYAVLSKVGAGGMADVFKARDLKLQRVVAIKVLRLEYTGAIGSKRFLREIETAATLSHPHILPVYDSGEVNGLLWYVMPYVDGESLRARLQRERQLPLGDAVRLAGELADALEHAHAHGVVHRDLKPGNVLLQGRHALLADFGIARAFAEADDRDRLTSTGVTLGTPHYMSPEQGTGEADVDARTDVYALGCVLYEMLVGEPPFTGPTARAIVARHVTQTPPSLRVVRPEVPGALERVVTTALSKTPAHRYATGGEMASALGALGIDTSTGGDALHRPARRLSISRRAAIVSALAVVMLGALGIWSRTARTGAPGATLSAFRIAVYPARIPAGPELAYLSEGLMDLLSGAIDGLGELRRVDPHELMSRLQREGVTPPIDLTTAVGLASDFAAGRYVLSSALPVGDELRISASLYDVSNRAEPVAEATEQGELERLPDLVESLVVQLVSELSLGSGGRLDDMRLPEVRFDVLRAYLEGEALLRRGQYQAAQARLEYAVDADSSFALGWYRLSMAEGAGSGNAGRHSDGGVSSIAHALEHAERLSLRDRLLVEAFHANRFGDSDQAAALALTATGRYPDNVEAWFALGDTWSIYGWRAGRSLAEAMEPLRRALSMDPGYSPAALRYSVAASFEHRFDELPRYLAAHPIGFLEGYLLQLAFHEGDSRTADSLLAIIANLSDGRFGEEVELIADTDSLRLARQLLADVMNAADRSSSLRASARFNRVLYNLSAGLWEEARVDLAEPQMRSLDAHTPIVYALAAVPFFDRPSSELTELRQSLGPLRIPPYEQSPILRGQRPPALHPWVKDYALGLLAARQGDAEEALRFAEQLESASEPEDPQGLRADLALEIRALVHATAGRQSDALLTLERAQYRVTRYGQAFSSYFKRSIGRFLRAELLRQLGREEEALAWYSTFSHTYPMESVFLAPALLRRGEILESRGDDEQALHFYQRFLARWRGANPEYQQLVRDVEGRVARLQAGGRL